VAEPAHTGVLSAAPAAGEDPETLQVLELFPQDVQQAILAALRKEEASAAEAACSEADEAASCFAGSESSGSTAPADLCGVQLVEVVVDHGRPVSLRLSSRKEGTLQDVQLSVEVSRWHNLFANSSGP
jgi:hypothetical protein